MTKTAVKEKKQVNQKENTLKLIEGGNNNEELKLSNYFLLTDLKLNALEKLDEEGIDNVLYHPNWNTDKMFKFLRLTYEVLNKNGFEVYFDLLPNRYEAEEEETEYNLFFICFKVKEIKENERFNKVFSFKKTFFCPAIKTNTILTTPENLKTDLKEIIKDLDISF